MNIKKASLIAGSVVCVLLLCISLKASAQTTTASTTQNSSSTSVIQTTAPAAQNALPAALQTRIVNLAANMSNRADALITRFELITVRMESRLRKMESAGYDTVDARFYIAESKKTLEKAKVEMDGIDAKIAAFVTAENYWDGWFTIRDSFSEIKSQLVTTKKLLAEALADMTMTAQGEPTLLPNASTTNTTTTN